MATIMRETVEAPEQDIKVRQAIDDHREDLKQRVAKLREKQATEHIAALWFKRCGVGLITIGTTLIIVAAIYSYSLPGICGAFLTVLSVGCFAFSLDHQAEERSISDDLKRLEFECDLMKLRPNGSECRAEKMLGNNDSQLRSYYELNLEQCSKIFWVGILCLLAGLGVIAATLQSVKMSRDDAHTQLIIGIVGAVGTVLINYVAAIFLKMHSEILAILKDFQNKLVNTQELYLANVLASRISDGTTRANALKDLSLAMVRSENTDKNGSRWKRE